MTRRRAASALVLLAAAAGIAWLLAPRPPAPPGGEGVELDELRLYQAAWGGCGAPDSVATGEGFLALARLRNTSPHPWPHRGNARVRLGYRWLDPGGSEIDEEVRRQDLEAPVAPGQALESWVRVLAPADPGRYVLELDLAYEPMAWFSERGTETCRVELAVR